MAIKSIVGQVIHDSRGDDTIQVTVTTDGGKTGSSAVPAGASKGAHEAKTVDPTKSVEFIAAEIAPALVGHDPFDQAGVDKIMIDLDGTPDKNRLGANTILGVSLAVSRAAAAETALAFQNAFNFGPLRQLFYGTDKGVGFFDIDAAGFDLSFAFAKLWSRQGDDEKA